jgi:hypothetical protein
MRGSRAAIDSQCYYRSKLGSKCDGRVKVKLDPAGRNSVVRCPMLHVKLAQSAAQEEATNARRGPCPSPDAVPYFVVFVSTMSTIYGTRSFSSVEISVPARVLFVLYMIVK